MPINPKSSALKEEFLAVLARNSINAIHQNQSIYIINNLKVSIRTTTKTDSKIWYDVSEGIINKVDYFIYQADSLNHFVLFEVKFFTDRYEQLRNSNRSGAKQFYIDWKNKKIVSDEFSQNISNYCCSMLDTELSGNWKQVFLR